MWAPGSILCGVCFTVLGVVQSSGEPTSRLKEKRESSKPSRWSAKRNDVMRKTINRADSWQVSLYRNDLINVRVVYLDESMRIWDDACFL